jgi:hypothetical protein
MRLETGLLIPQRVRVGLRFVGPTRGEKEGRWRTGGHLPVADTEEVDTRVAQTGLK